MAMKMAAANDARVPSNNNCRCFERSACASYAAATGMSTTLKACTAIQGVLRETPGDGVNGDFTRRAKIAQDDVVGEKADPHGERQNEKPKAGGIGAANHRAIHFFDAHS